MVLFHLRKAYGGQVPCRAALPTKVRYSLKTKGVPAGPGGQIILPRKRFRYLGGPLAHFLFRDLAGQLFEQEAADGTAEGNDGQRQLLVAADDN